MQTGLFLGDILGIRYHTFKLCILAIFWVLPAFAQEISIEEYQSLKKDFDFLQTLVQKIEHTQMAGSASFISYRDAYFEYSENLKAQPASRAELQEQLQKSRLILFGDEHSNSRSQENIVWVMEQMKSGRAEGNVLMIEWIEKRYQSHIDAYLAGEISDSALKERIEFEKSWGFSWSSHLRILDAAKRLGFAVVAAENKIDKSGMPIPLRTRDNHVVESVANVFSENSEARILLAYGEAHLAGGKDKHLREKLEGKGLVPDTILFPRIEAGYWDVLRETLNLEKAAVLRYSPSEFYLDQGTVERNFEALRYYFSQLGLGESQLNFVKARLTSIPPPKKTGPAPGLCREIFASF